MERWGKKEADAFLEREWLKVASDQGSQTTSLNYCYFLADYAGDKSAAEEKFDEALSGLAKLGGFSWSSKLQNWMDLMGTKVLVLFIGLYLGVVFLLAAAAVLALQQLTQAADSAGQYRVLSLPVSYTHLQLLLVGGHVPLGAAVHQGHALHTLSLIHI